jgi:hypothetical protein
MGLGGGGGVATEQASSGDTALDGRPRFGGEEPRTGEETRGGVAEKL